MELKDGKILDFWNEFSAISKQICLSPEDNDIIKKVDFLVNSLGAFDWEYGPYKPKGYYFALSPNFQIGLLEQVDYIVSLSPKIDNWEIISCKPKKIELLDEWEMLNENGETIVVKTNNWKCVIYKYSDGMIELDIVIDNVDGNDQTKYIAVDIHLSNILGERKYMKKINTVSIVDDFVGDLKERYVLVNELDKYL